MQLFNYMLNWKMGTLDRWFKTFYTLLFITFFYIVKLLLFIVYKHTVGKSCDMYASVGVTFSCTCAWYNDN